jgi:chromate transporter
MVPLRPRWMILPGDLSRYSMLVSVTTKSAERDGQSPQEQSGSLREVALLFLKLGVIGFGGPAAHVALMRAEVVKRGWVTEQQFLDLLGASNLIPGPSSTELGMFLGHARAGRRGLIIAGVLFILPAMLIVLALAGLYVRYGSQPGEVAVLAGVKPVIIALVVQALWGLGRTALKGIPLGLIGASSLALYFLAVNPVVLILGGGLLLLAVRQARSLKRLHFQMILPVVPAIGKGAVRVAVSASLGTLFLTFLKTGAVVYGSGYVLLAFLHDDFVTRLHWLTNRQLIDAVAIGQVTPGPVFTTATFIGYLVSGWQGALLATLGIFLPSFVFAALVYPLIPRLRASPIAGAFLDGVNASAVGLMIAVTVQLGRSAIVDPVSALETLVAAALLFRFRLNATWLVLGGAALGIARLLLPWG